MDRADIKLAILLAYVVAMALHALLAAAILRRKTRRFEVRIFAAANVVLAVWHFLQLIEYAQIGDLLTLRADFYRILTGAQLVLGMLVLGLFFHLFATFERIYRRKSPSLRAAITTHVHRRSMIYIPVIYILIFLVGMIYSLDAGGVGSQLRILRESIGPTYAYLQGLTLLFMTFVLFPAREGQEKILVPALGRALFLILLAVCLGLVFLWHQSHPQRVQLLLVPVIHLSSLFFCIFLALIRYEFSFMDRYILDGLRFLTWSVVVLVAYFLFNRLFFEAEGWGRYATSMGRVGILLFAVGFGPWAGSRVARLAHRYLFLRTVNLKKGVATFSLRLARSSTLDQLIDGAGKDIAAAVHAHRIHIAVGHSREVEAALRGKVDYRLRIPLGGDLEPAGWLLLGERKNRYPYFDGEREYLASAAQLLGGAITSLRSRESAGIHRPSKTGSPRTDMRELEKKIETLEDELRRLRSRSPGARPCVDSELVEDSLAVADEVARKNPETALTILHCLRFVHSHLDSGRQMLTDLNLEMEFAQNLLTLEKLRRRNRLEVNLHFDNSLAQRQLPVGILLPLIRNALGHGLAHQLGENLLEIRAVSMDDHWILTVEDNGRGFPPSYFVSSARASGGIAEVASSLQKHCPGSQLVVEKDRVEGACVRLEIPCAAEDEI